MRTNTSQEKLPVDYFLLVFLLTVPSWLFGGSRLPLPINLPASAAATFIPAIAAVILTYLRSGLTGVKDLLSRAWDFKKTRNKAWYLAALFLPPLIYGLSYVIMRLVRLPLPDRISIPWTMAPAFFVGFLIGDTGEELGWSGYAIDRMQNRWGAVKASLVLGIVWAIWHSIPFVQTHNPASWIVWQSIRTVGMRMVIVWIYNHSGKSVLASNLYHVTDNLCWAMFPNYGSHYDPLVNGALTWLTVILVVLGWGAKLFNKKQEVI